MKSSNIPLLLALLASAYLTHGPAAHATEPPNYKPLTLEDIFEKKTFKLKTINGIQWQQDSTAFYYNKPEAGNKDRLSLYKHSLATGEETKILSASALTLDGEPLNISQYTPTTDNQYILLTGKPQKIWRISQQATYYIYNTKTQKITALADGTSNLINVHLSHDNQHIAYTQNNNLYLTRLDNLQTRQLTHDGSDNILNGVFDWVYEEEFEHADAWQWSPDSKKIAYWHTDQSRVKTFTLIDELPTYNKPRPLKYPKAGEQNAIVKIGVIDITTGTTQWIDSGSNDDIYLPRIRWARDSQQLTIQRLNRRQNHLEYLLADTRNGKTRKIAEESSKAWIDITDDTSLLKKTDHLLWTSEKSGYRHLYLTDYTHNKTRQITHGDWDITQITGTDETGHWAYFLAKKQAVTEQHLYRVSLQSQQIQKISQNLGHYQANHSPDYQYYIQSASSLTTPSQISLRHADGKLVRMLEKNDLPAFKQHPLSHPQIINFKTSDDVQLNAQITKPLNFDPNKKYPVIVSAYGAPSLQLVLNAWPGVQGDWGFYLAQEGYILFTLDNRGTCGRGTAFKHLAHGDFSKWAVHDQIEGARYLRSLPYVDPQRIGFWGKSFGGYLTGLLMTRATDYFSTGISLAMVSDFYNYDTIWTERYLGLPADNPAGYLAASILPHTDALKGNLLLVHGTGDDNVHLQNTLQWADVLIAHNKPFELMLYPNRNHSLTGDNTRLHLYSLMTRYFRQHLGKSPDN